MGQPPFGRSPRRPTRRPSNAVVRMAVAELAGFEGITFTVWRSRFTVERRLAFGGAGCAMGNGKSFLFRSFCVPRYSHGPNAKPACLLRPPNAKRRTANGER